MDIDKAEMTPWYDPRQLFNTAQMDLISTTLGKYVDPRANSGMTGCEDCFDYSHQVKEQGRDFTVEGQKEREEIWIDYVADVGDGWNSTYAVAYLLAQPELTAELRPKTRKELAADLGDDVTKTPGEERAEELNAKTSFTTPRGELLIFGGDEVYPTASPSEYERRLVVPYRLAYKAGAKSPPKIESELANQPHTFALPGNHDWYDGLVAFRALFCSHVLNDRKFAGDSVTGKGGWRTRQAQSYFALRLPHNWWLLALDLQLTHDIDAVQFDHFDQVIKNMEAGAKVILCVPEPYWVRAMKYRKITDKFAAKDLSLNKLERVLADRGIEIKMFVAGDLHHYRRFQDAHNVQKITAGGGGAFLHPTHDFDFRGQRPRERFRLEAAYPGMKQSRSLDWKNLFLFLENNPTFGFFTAAIYFLLAGLVHGKLPVGPHPTYWSLLRDAFRASISRMIDQPLALAVMVFLFLGLIFFTDSNSKAFKWIGGFLHGLAHLTAAFILGWTGYWLSLRYIALRGLTPPGEATIFPYARYDLIWLASVFLVSSIGGYLFGSAIMGAYLFVALHGPWKRHDNEAFSALKIEDYKNFLRLHIDRQGDLTIYPFKIDRVPRQWSENDPESPEFLVPEAPLAAELIEAPIKISGVVRLPLTK